MEISVGSGSSTSSSTVMDRKRGGRCCGRRPKRLRWSNQTPQFPQGPVSSALSPSPMLLSVLAWLFYPGSCLGHQATFLHMHSLNFWPGTSSQGCIRETVVQSGVVGPPMPPLLSLAYCDQEFSPAPWGLTPETGPATKTSALPYNRRTVRLAGWCCMWARQPLLLQCSLSVSLLQTDVRSGALSAIWCSTQTQWLCCTPRQPVCVCVCVVCVCVFWCCVCGAQPCGKKEEQRSQSTRQPPFSSVGLDELPAPCNRVLLDD